MTDPDEPTDLSPMDDTASSSPAGSPAGDPAPTRYELDPADRRTKLRENVIEAINALPFHFASPINIEGLDAGDLFQLNTLLGGAIEVQTVDTLNRIRSVWDPDDEWQDYGFKRFSQSFPDVRLVRGDNTQQPILGIELKGWYLLSKEAEPSFRYQATAEASSVWDLLVCVPWTLSNVLSGSPRILEPYVEQAKYAADMRTYYWKHLRAGDAGSRNSDIHVPQGVTPYAPAGTSTSDKPAQDGGGNFGRVARIRGLMSSWISGLVNSPVSGIPAKYWIDFLKAFSESNDQEQLRRKITALVRRADTSAEEAKAERVYELLSELRQTLN
ncbi:hypothetical protein V6S67_19810 [Arthrobacter sp. Soc17.1.1.1]|uniref:hypothetical protein n=1 Tax=Arthrobacter sp. Soc17.1.1.1 TaxID=3121277 RepID=UPI002FE4C149